MIADVSKVLLLLVLSGPVSLANAQQLSAATEAAVPGSLQDILRKPAVMRGTLGGDKIQLTLAPKTDEDGFQGKYFIFGQSAQVLLAGEVAQNDLMMEESRNGKDVSGQWEGSFRNGVLSGTWSSPDDAVTKPFSLRPGKP